MTSGQYFSGAGCMFLYFPDTLLS